MRRRAAIGLALGLLAWLAVPDPPGARGDSYRISPDAEVVCLERASGRELWRATPGPLYPDGALVVRGGAVIASDDRHRHVLALADGAPCPEPEAGPEQGPAPPLPRPLVDRHGRAFAFDPGNTRHLQLRDGTVVRSLPDFPDALHVTGDLALFTLSEGVARLGGGEVLAWDLGTARLRWTFEAWRHVPGIRDGSWVGIGLDGPRVLVSCEQVLFALTLADGRLLWRRDLPRQPIRRYDAPWTTFARDGERLLVRCYEDLFCLEAATGELLWSYDPGPFARPWPTLAGDRLLLVRRPEEGGVDQLGASSGGGHRDRERSSAVQVRLLPGGEVDLRFAPRHEIPAGSEFFSPLQPPPPPTVAGPRYLLRLEGREEWVELDVSAPLGARGEVWIKLYGPTADRAALLRDGQTVRTARPAAGR